MNMHTLLQAETVLAKSAEMAQKDPHGWIITVVSISVVFISLALLFVLYNLIGKLVIRFSRDEQLQENPSGEETATAEPVDTRPHDKESYIITISPKDSIDISSQAPVIAGSAADAGTDLPDAANAVRVASWKDIMAPLPGVITSIKVKAGDSIKSGQVVAVLEAMKMENDLQSEVDGTVREVKVEKGDSVLEGAVIITLE
jgi:biotin carboxyl carrier protein